MTSLDDATRARRLLAVVAHPDDETFGCGSLLLHAAEHGMTTAVACATRGEAGAPPSNHPDDFDLGDVREGELRRAASVLGVAHVDVLGWRDSDMTGTPAPGSLVAAPIDAVADAVANLVDGFRPHVVVTLDASDGHRDHQHIRDATLLAVERTTWTVPSVYLHCLPHTLMQRWAAELAAKQPDSAHLALGELGTPEELVTTVIDTSSLLARRERAIALHASQTPPFAVMPPELRREFLTVEHLRRVRPPWNGGPVERELLVP
jgi:LmbE family N-acetylglucosaminyl deacetylase